MQTIETKFLAPTNTKGQRIKAQTSAGSCSVTVDYNDGLSAEGNHQRAAQKCLDKTGWQISRMIGGSTKLGMTFVSTYGMHSNTKSIAISSYGEPPKPKRDNTKATDAFLKLAAEKGKGEWQYLHALVCAGISEGLTDSECNVLGEMFDRSRLTARMDEINAEVRKVVTAKPIQLHQYSVTVTWDNTDPTVYGPFETESNAAYKLAKVIEGWGDYEWGHQTSHAVKEMC